MTDDDRYIRREAWWSRNTPATATPAEAAERLDAILSDRLLWFNPYRVADADLLECAERGHWLPFPSITQMMVFHFHKSTQEFPDCLSFNIGMSDYEYHLNLNSLTMPMTHVVSRKPVWTLLNGCHLIPSNLHTLPGRSMFVSHAVICERITGKREPAYRMHRLYGGVCRRAAVIRESMCTAKIDMLQEVLAYPLHPDYLGNTCDRSGYASKIDCAIKQIRLFPTSTPPTKVFL